MARQSHSTPPDTSQPSPFVVGAAADLCVRDDDVPAGGTSASGGGDVDPSPCCHDASRAHPFP